MFYILRTHTHIITYSLHVPKVWSKLGNCCGGGGGEGGGIDVEEKPSSLSLLTWCGAKILWIYINEAIPVGLSLTSLHVLC